MCTFCDLASMACTDTNITVGLLTRNNLVKGLANATDTTLMSQLISLETGLVKG